MRFNDITGQKFGRLTALEYVGNGKWLCRCDCDGKEIETNTYSLTHGLTKSCGCLRREVASSSKLKDIKGLTFGDWTVLEYAGSSMWKCRCSCGVIRNVKSESLINGASKSCGHDTTGYKDFTDNIIDTWWVVRPVGKQWECICTNCNRVVMISHDSLLHNRQRKCECVKRSKQLIDITNKKFGHLTAIEYIGNNLWKCLCDCGNISIHYSHNLRRSNNTISCGCMEVHGYSKDEVIEKIEEFQYQTGELPTRIELSAILQRSITSVNRYIERFNLQDYVRCESNKSSAEKEIALLYKPTSTSVRNILDNYEIDLYYDTVKLGIEYNGIYWHSTKFKDKNYHQDKSLEALRHKIRLIHIFEYEWINKEKHDKIIAYLNDIISDKNTRQIYARKTTIKEISNIDAINFCNKYHLQGGINSSINIGCFYNEELIGVMTFGKPRFSNNEEWEILRLAFMSGTKVLGGAQKMFEYFTTKYKPHNIISYCDIAKFSGNIYRSLGFILDSITSPNYVWSNSVGEVYTRYQTQKHKLISYGFCDSDTNLTEDDIMKSLGYYKIYDSGSYKFVWSSI